MPSMRRVVNLSDSVIFINEFMVWLRFLIGLMKIIESFLNQVKFSDISQSMVLS